MSHGQATLTWGQNYALVVARVCMASLFLWSGAEKVYDFHGAIDFAEHMGVPFAGFLMPLAIILELGAGLALVAGYRARSAAGVLAIWMLILGPWFHQFWNAPPQLWQLTIDDFLHHFVMIGAMIIMMVFGPGDLVIRTSKLSST